ncbi:hypothetical protein AB0F96_22205 [Streptomyces sp. NPDC023998]|uniref:hypothetical protein n=1 Tax=Streptomyces sp. NPDC023998 TaxID=3154597 RepID=UPI0033DD8B8F
MAFTAGCGSAVGKSEERERPQRLAAPSTGSGKALGQRELEQAAVSQKDLPARTFDALLDPISTKRSPVDPASCQAVADSAGLSSWVLPTARVKQVIGSAKGDHGGSMALASHTPAEASRMIQQVRTALRSCNAFTPAFGFAYEGVTVLPDPRLGDESVSFRLLQVVSSEGEKPLKVPVTVIVVRVGAALATFQAANFERNGQAVVPRDVVDEQLIKLTDAAR